MKKVKRVIYLLCFFILFINYKCNFSNGATENEQLINNGIYIIKSSTKEEFSLDVTGMSKENCANIELWTKNYGTNQQFKVEYIGNGYYTIISCCSNKSLDVAWASKANGANVEQYTLNNGNNQKWMIKDAGNGSYYIVSKCNGLYLDIANNEYKNGTNILMWQSNGGNNQKFKFEKLDLNPKSEKTIEDGTYTIKSALDNSFVLDIEGASAKDCANVELWKNNNGTNQMFNVKYLNDGYYSIEAVNSKKSLDVAWASKTNGANVEQYTINGGDNQKWIIHKTEDGLYNIISKCNGLYMDVANSIAKNGTNILMWQFNGGKNQKFKFEKVNTTSANNTTTNNNTNTTADNNKTTIEIDATKYPGYKEKIETLMKAHPKWNFELLYTKLSYSNVIAGETAVHSRNLVPTDYGGEWVCTTCGTKLYDSGWYCASAKAVAYYMDPRNFLDETNVFQFVDVNKYSSDFTITSIQAQVNGTYLHNYAEDINNACKNKGVNPFYIISRLIQEQGRNGTTIGTGMDGGDGKTYYNPFDIGATGNGKDEIYANALAKAKSEGWDTMQKAIEGGITFCKKNWLDNYQNTLYQNKFDIDTRNGTALYNHQYMQNLMGAYSEARLLRDMYSKSNIINANITFIIPVYEGMEKENYSQPLNNSESYPIDVETTGTYIRIREGASTSTKILRTLETKGTRLLSVQRGVNSDWQKVITTDGLIGYISGNYVKQIDDIKTCNYTASVRTASGNGCNVRVGPSTRVEKATALADDTKVTVIDNSTYKNIDGYDWCRIIMPNGLQAFIPNQYLI